MSLQITRQVIALFTLKREGMKARRHGEIPVTLGGQQVHLIRSMVVASNTDMSLALSPSLGQLRTIPTENPFERFSPNNSHRRVSYPRQQLRYAVLSLLSDTPIPSARGCAAPSRACSVGASPAFGLVTGRGQCMRSAYDIITGLPRDLPRTQKR